MDRVMQVPVIDSGGVFQDWANLHKVDTVTSEITSMDADTLNYWLSKFVMEEANSEGKRYPARTIYDLICGLNESRGANNVFIVSFYNII